MEPNQVHLVAAAVSCDSQQIIHALEPRFTGQIVRDVGEAYRRNRIHDDVALVHPVTTPHLYMGAGPDANAAFDSSAPDSLAKAFGEHHYRISSDGQSPRTKRQSRLMIIMDQIVRARTQYQVTTAGRDRREWRRLSEDPRVRAHSIHRVAKSLRPD
jgi:hypothetical protein